MARASARRVARNRGPWWAWLCVVVGTLLTVASGGALAGFSILTDRYTGGIPADDLLGDVRGERGTRETLAGPLNILLVGSDYRKNPELKGTLWRADTIMVLHVPRSHDQAYLISFPRDTMVDIPDSGNSRWKGGEDKINSAFTHGGNGASGYRLLARTLSDLLDIRFDSGAVIDFYGFVNVVQALGGVDLCIETPKGKQKLRSIHPPYRVFEKGCRHYDGHAALDYVRQRKQFNDGDFARMRHQQEFLKALLAQTREQGLHRDLGKLDRVIRAAGPALTVDNTLPVADLAFTLRNIRPENLTAIQVPVEGRNEGTWYAELVDPAPDLFRAVREETVGAWSVQNPKYVNPLT
ncbi:MAG TPA: LCP family protein [Micromonosporaceae bacterium]|nr:LCP family protein [Micromonosporaceae bacterium]